MEIYENLDIQDLYGEIWKDIEEYDGKYQISNFSRIKSFKYNKINGKILKQQCDGSGHLYFRFFKNGRYKNIIIHRLLYETFIKKLKKNYDIHHIDFNPKNNNFSNFQLMTNKEHHKLHMNNENNPNTGCKRTEKTRKKMSNTRKKIIENGSLKILRGEDSPNHKLTEEQVVKIKLLLKEGILTQREIADMFGVSQLTISAIKTGKIWAHIKIKVSE